MIFRGGGGGGGSGPPNPLWIRTWGRLTPLFAYRIMVYQNLNKTEKYHPTTTKRKKLSPAGRDSKCGSRGGLGVRTPLEKSRYMGFYRVKAIGPPGKSWTPPPPGKCWTPSGTFKNDSFLRN